LLFKTTVYLHRKKRRLQKKERNTNNTHNIHAMLVLMYQIKNDLWPIREPICLPSSRICDIVGCSRERRKYYRVHNQISSVTDSCDITEKQKKFSIRIYFGWFVVFREAFVRA
jgi:hypothetical protein